ncbi:MAG: protein kinase [Deltaproteobacteria bacterium]|nr:protein kinase [Deltaproteobacteria bacterium]
MPPTTSERGDSLVGVTLGGEYEVIARLGSGGFGEVLRARRLGADGFAKDVALKMLHPRMDHAPDIVNRLKDEARFLGLLSHPAIVKVDLLTRIQDRWTVVMELVEGVDLRALLRAYGPLPAGVVMHIGAEVASALDYAYNHPVTQPGGARQPLHLLHRDIKPPNIQLTPHGEVKVLDFGIAKAELDSREAVTGSHVYMTKEYAAPERLRGVEHPAGDVFSLGAVLAELLTGEELDLIAPMLEAMLRGEPIDARAVVRERLTKLDASLARVEGLPAPARALILQTLTWDHEERPLARTLAKELRAQEAAVGYDFLEFCDRFIGPTVRGEGFPPQTVRLGMSAPFDASIGLTTKGPPQRSAAKKSALMLGGLAAGVMAGGLALAVGLTLWPSAPPEPVGTETTVAKTTVGATDPAPEQTPDGPTVTPPPVDPPTDTKASQNITPPPVTERREPAQNKQPAEAIKPPDPPPAQATPASDARPAPTTTQEAGTAEVHLEGELAPVWVLGPDKKMVKLARAGTTIAPGVYEAYADLGKGEPEPVGLTLTARAGEKVTLFCSKLSARCSIRAVTP